MLNEVRTFVAAMTVLLATAVMQPVAAADSTMPHVSADSQGGKHVTLPDDERGQPFVLAIGYDRSAASDLQRWSHKLNENVPSGQLFGVVVAAGVPFFVKGTVRKAIAKSAPITLPAHRDDVLITFEDVGWRTFATSGKASDCAIVVVDGAGTIRYRHRGPYDAAIAADAIAAFAAAKRS